MNKEKEAFVEMAKDMFDFNEAQRNYVDLVNSWEVYRNPWIFASLVSNQNWELDDKIKEVIEAKIKYRELSQKINKH